MAVALARFILPTGRDDLALVHGGSEKGVSMCQNDLGENGTIYVTENFPGPV